MDGSRALFQVRNYDLASTLNSGQAFRWIPYGDGWEGVVGNHWVWLRQTSTGIEARTASPVRCWDWLADYLQIDVDFRSILRSFPKDPPMQAAVRACRGLRLLRQNTWECLASFICSSSKQIVQIRQIIAMLCERYGQSVDVPSGHPPAFAFPKPATLARCTENELRECRMGFRAPHLRDAAIEVATGRLRLETLAELPLDSARQALVRLRGVGLKIADCVLLFSGIHPQAFPIDTWIRRALSKLYFPDRRVTDKQLREFAASHFGPWAGYAQQYLFHYTRVISD